jgi:hypothetical protein
MVDPAVAFVYSLSNRPTVVPVPNILWIRHGNCSARGIVADDSKLRSIGRATGPQKMKDGGLIMVAKSWKSWMLGTLLGVGGLTSMNQTAVADPPWGISNNRGGIVHRNGVHYGNGSRVFVPNPNYSYSYNYSYRYGQNPAWGYHHPHPCQPIYGVPYHGVPQYGSYYGSYYSRPTPSVGIVIGGWPSGPSFGGGGFPAGPSFGGGSTFRIGR